MFMFYKVDITWYTVSELVSFFAATSLVGMQYVVYVLKGLFVCHIYLYFFFSAKVQIPPKRCKFSSTLIFSFHHSRRKDSPTMSHSVGQEVVNCFSIVQ